MTVVKTSEIKAFPNAPEGGDGRFGASLRPLSPSLGLRGLGAMVVEVEPGKRAFPFHNHLGNDELFVILAGTGTWRFGDGEREVEAGDVCAAPRGGPDTAHQLANTGTETLRYVGISTCNDPDVVEYPDSGKFAAIAIAPGKSFFDAHLRFVGRTEDSRDYWEGELGEKGD